MIDLGKGRRFSHKTAVIGLVAAEAGPNAGTCYRDVGMPHRPTPVTQRERSCRTIHHGLPAAKLPIPAAKLAWTWVLMMADEFASQSKVDDRHKLPPLKERSAT
jgi:hypothetical protein